MENFKIYNPTVVHFGRGVTSILGKTASLYGKKALFVYGKNSIKKNGVYNIIIEQLSSHGITIVEFGGIKANPVYKDVDTAALLGRKENVDFIVAAGGGSVIDSAKMISISVPANHSAWDFYERKSKPVNALPLLTILTLAATGTEMNCFAVLQNDEILKKEGYVNPLMFPRHSFLDPQFTYSVPGDLTAYGAVDLIAHCLEHFFGTGEAPMSDRLAAATIAETMDCAPSLLKKLTDYELRARLMYAATIALNGWNSYGKVSGDWGVHSIGHILSLICDIPHGASLSIAYPAWMKFHKKLASEKINLLGNLLFGTNSTDDTINKLEEFFKNIGSPVKLSEAGINKEAHDQILNTMIKNKVSGYVYKMNDEDIKAIFELML